MKIHEITTQIEVYHIDELSDKDKTLLQHAKEACFLSHSPYSNFKVGCAIRSNNGSISKGANQENAAYPVCLCAEGVALAHAAMLHPGVPFESMAITVKTQNGKAVRPVGPCGICRQSILEYENRFKQPIRIIMHGDSGDVYVIQSIKDILPLSFEADDLK